MVKVYLCSEDMSYTLLLPVTPSEITVSDGTGVRAYETVNNGNISHIGFEELTGVGFSSFFPSNRREYSLNNSMFGMSYVESIKRFKEHRMPYRLIIIGMGIDQTMILERFEYSMKQGKDVYYSMQFKEKR